MKKLILCLSLLLWQCQKETPVLSAATDKTIEYPSTDLKDIKKRGKLVVLTRYNANTYFLYKGQEMGFEYELLKKYAQSIGVDLEIKTPQSWDSLTLMLKQGEGDLIAANLTVTSERKKELAFVTHHNTTRQMLIQKKPSHWKSLKVHQLEKKLLRNPLGLIGEKVHIRPSSSYAARLTNLSNEMGGEIIPVYVAEDTETETLLAQVHVGKIKYTIADENLAKLHSFYMPNLDIGTPISFPQRIAWAINPKAIKLKASINQWIQALKANQNPEYYVIYNKYYKNKRAIKKRQQSEFNSLKGDKISKFDADFKKHQTERFDWRLLAAQAYQESHFDPKTKSWAGALGLMQLLPTTAQELGDYDLTNPDQNVAAAVKYLKKVYQHYWKDLPPDQALAFTLASYNAGPGHVLDAQRLAKSKGLNPQIWEGHVSEMILLLAQEKYYTLPEVKYGYCRGQEPYNYVKEILHRFSVYKKRVPKI
jgi:membrane-bound lytic murein transglycosylase F